MKADLFWSCGWVFQIFFAYWLQHCNRIVFRILNNTTGISSPSRALFIVMLLRLIWLHTLECLALDELTPSWLSESWRYFFYSSSVYSFHLFLTSSVPVRCITFLSFIVPIFAWNVPLVSLIFLKRSLEREEIFPFYCFLYFFALFT